jgi:hypothetical protein
MCFTCHVHQIVLGSGNEEEKRSKFYVKEDFCRNYATFGKRIQNINRDIRL